jgi:hypothetical protein
MRVVRRKLREHRRAGAAQLGSALDAKPRHGRRRAAQLRLRPGCVEARRQRAAGAQRAVVQGHAPTAGGILRACRVPRARRATAWRQRLEQGRGRASPTPPADVARTPLVFDGVGGTATRRPWKREVGGF